MSKGINNAMIVTMLSLFSVAAIAESRATLTLKPHVIVERDALRLADVADIQTADAALHQALSNVRLGEMLMSHARVYGRGMLAMFVKQDTANPVVLDWQGAERVTIERRTQMYAQEALIEAAREHLLAFLRETDPELTRIDIRVADRVESVRLPTGTVSVVPRAVRSSALSKRMCVWLDIAVDGQVRRSVPTWLAVNAYKPVRVAQRTLAARERVTEDDFRVEERDVTDAMRRPLPSADDVAGWRVRRALAAGSVVLTGDVEAQPAVIRDQEVRVQVASGSVVLETSAVAEQEGKIGDEIKLRNPSSDKSYLGRIVGAGQVFVSAR